MLLWPILLAITCLVAVGALGAMRALSNIFPFDTESEARNTQVINSVTRQEQVVLLSLGIQGIAEKKKPAATFLGIDGKDVRIVKTGEDEFRVSIPAFVFIGHDNEEFSMVTENNGVLSWMTPQIDAVEMINNILNDEAKDDYIDSNEAILRDQAMVFYKSIIASIDSTIDVQFEFRD